MGLYDEIETQVLGALEAWDYRSVASSGVVLADEWPYERTEDILGEGPDRQMTKPMITVVGAHSTDTFRGLGGQMSTAGPPPSGGTTRYATRAGVALIVSCWADQKLGGYDTVKKLAGQVQGCLFYNRNRLSAYRHLRVKVGDPSFEERDGLWSWHLTVEGDAVVSIDV